MKKRMIKIMAIVAIMVLSVMCVACKNRDTKVVANSNAVKTTEATTEIVDSTEDATTTEQDVPDIPENTTVPVGSTEKPEQTTENTTESEPAAENDTPTPTPEPEKDETCNHSWENIYETVVVTDKEAYDEQVCVQEAYDEEVPIYETKRYIEEFLCDEPSTCVASELRGIWWDYGQIRAYCDPRGYSYCVFGVPVDVEVQVGTKTVHHDAVYETVHHDAVTHEEQRVVGQRCVHCHITK